MLWSVLFSSLLSQALCVSYSNHWSSLVPGGIEKAKQVAEDTGCELLYEIIPGEEQKSECFEIFAHVISGDNYYLYQCHHVSKRSTDSHEETHKTIAEHKHVTETKQEVVKSRRRRQWGNWGGGGGGQFGQMGGGLFNQQQPWRMPQKQTPAIDPNTPFDNPMNFNDPRYPLMWYANRGGMLDMNVQEAWKMGITGKDIVVTILDDGVEKNNPDLVENYDPGASADINDNDPDPTPRYDLIDSNRHGTRCAGEVSASANNSICGVGIAFKSKIGGVRMLDGDVTDAVEARSLSLNNQHIDIYRLLIFVSD